jgi:hypothetical protein
MTINEAMALQKAVKTRWSELVRLRDSVAVERETTWFGEPKSKKEDLKVKYDVKTVDKKITELHIFLFKIDAAIKQVNAKTEINISADVDSLLAPLQ